MNEIQAHFYLQRTSFHLDVTFQVSGKGVTVLYGPSGSGKTTILRCMAGLERPHPGFLQINEQCWQDESRHWFIPTHQRPIGYVFQEASLFPHLSVRKNIEYGFRRTASQFRQVVFDEVIDLLGVAPLFMRRPEHLSGGERQRVAIARALLTSPKLLLMDEPLAALDMPSKLDILPYLEKLHEELAIPVLYVTHALEEVRQFADHLLFIEQGKILAEGPLIDLLTRLDLPLSHAQEAGAIIEGQVIEHDECYHLTTVEFSGGYLSVPKEHLPIGRRVRVMIIAKDVSLALENEVRSSILNIFQATMLEMVEDLPGQLTVKVDIKGTFLLAKLTKKSAVLLNLQRGMSVYVRVKSVALL